MQLIRDAAQAGWAKLQLPGQSELDAIGSLAAYESLRSLLPENRSRTTQTIHSLSALIDDVDAFILDGYGVINVGESLIPGIASFLAAAEAAGKPVIVLTNGASHASSGRAAKYQSWDLPIKAEQIVSSRDAFLHMLNAEDSVGNLMSLDGATSPIGREGELRFESSPDAFAQADSFVMLGATGWDKAQNDMLIDALLSKPRPLYIANPDISAPQNSGFSAEPGYWGLHVMQATGQLPIWAGKPHPPAYELALQQLVQMAGREIPRDRIAMVGDSLHTDILGANHMGLKSVLLTGYGLLKGLDWQLLTDETGIYPDYQTVLL